MARKKNIAIDPNLTLAQLSQAYLDFIEKDGKSVGTCFSYCQELKTAMNELGAETLVSELTADAIQRFNNSKKVTRLKSGKPKSQLSIDKTRRVLRLALVHAEQSGLIAASPIPAKANATSDAPAPAKKRRSAKTGEATAPDTTSDAVPEATPVETAA